MDFHKINLNLLLILDALLTESHVSLAGERMGLSQPAMSHALKQLRTIYQDQLLVRGQHSAMELTPLAQSLKQPVRKAIEEIHIVFKGRESFVAAQSTRTFHIGLSDYLAFVLMPQLTHLCLDIAPNIKITLHHLNRFKGIDDFKDQSLDLVLGAFDHVLPTLKSQRLFTDNGVYVMKVTHPLAAKKKITLKDTAAYPHIMVSYVDDPKDTFIDRIYRQAGFNAVSRIIVPHGYMALYGVAQSTMITHTVARLATPFVAAFNLVLKDSPFPCPPYVAKQYWQPSMQDDPAHQWLRQTIKRLCEAL